MTITAITRNAKGAVSVMAGATRLAFFHFLHTNLVAVGFRPEGVWVAFIAAKLFNVDRVRKNYLTNYFVL